jgi:hypothetical protein
MALHLMRFAFSLLVAACIGTLAAAEQPHERQLQGVQAFGTVQTPKQPKVVVREWGPKFPSSTGDRKLLTAQAFGTVTTPKQPKVVAREWGPKFPSSTGDKFPSSTGDRKLLAAQAFGTVTTPKQPKVVALEWGPKFPSSTGDRKLLGNANTAAPKQPTAVSDSRFERKPGSTSNSAFSEGGDRKLLAAQAFGTVTTPKQPKVVVREWGPKFPSSTGDRKLLGNAATATPKQPKAVSDSRFERKPGSPSSSAASESGDRKLLAAAPTKEPTKPRAVSDSRFTSKPGSPSNSASEASQGDK